MNLQFNLHIYHISSAKCMGWAQLWETDFSLFAGYVKIIRKKGGDKHGMTKTLGDDTSLRNEIWNKCRLNVIK